MRGSLRECTYLKYVVIYERFVFISKSLKNVKTWESRAKHKIMLPNNKIQQQNEWAVKEKAKSTKTCAIFLWYHEFSDEIQMVCIYHRTTTATTTTTITTVYNNTNDNAEDIAKQQAQNKQTSNTTQIRIQNNEYFRVERFGQIRDLNPSCECYPKSYLLRVICKHSICFSPFVF